MLKFSKLTKYPLFDLQEDFKNYFMIKKNDYKRDLDDEEIEEIKFYQRFLKDIK